MDNKQKIDPAAGLSHVAFIMDGNGRWAQKRGMPREYGHTFGVKAFRAVVDHCYEIGLPVATFYAFSTENWKRPAREVNAIMKLLDSYIAECEKKMAKYDMRLIFIGDKSAFDEKRRARMEHLEKSTAGGKQILNIALNYGGRDELVHAFNTLAAAGKTQVDAADIAGALYTAAGGDPDLIVRTGGDLRISNFLLWQAAYAELYFTDTLWPDFTPADVDAAIAEFYTRKRRFGGV